MKLLLDTHTVIWYIWDDPRLPDHIRQMIKDNSNKVYISVVSLWEISIKTRQGKLDLNRSLREIVRLFYQNGFRLLSVSLKHVYRLDMLEQHHKDPFDRMLSPKRWPAVLPSSVATACLTITVSGDCGENVIANKGILYGENHWGSGSDCRGTD